MPEEVAATSGVSKSWTSRELRLLSDNAGLGANELAELLGRSPDSIRGAAYRSRISLRRPGSRQGSVLGQPRGVSLRGEDIRADILSGKVDPGLLARRMRIDREAALCPSCGKRPIRVDATGLCRVCHLDRLSEVHLEALQEHDAERALWATRQALQRARRGVRS